MPTSTLSRKFTLTNEKDHFVGGGGNDTFNGTYSDGGVLTNTFNVGDSLDGGGGIDTLIITPNTSIGAGAAATTLNDGLWAHISHIEDVAVTTNAGALNITTGPFFEAAFLAAGVHLAATSGAGAMSIDMHTFTGAATIVATTTGAGAQTITTDSAHVASANVTVTADAFAGAQTITGADLISVSAINHGAGAQTITSTGAGAVTVTAIGFSGAQTITTGAGNDHIAVTTSAGATNTVTSGAGNDVITLSGAAGAASHNTITGGLGADHIDLGVQTVGTVDTLVYSPGDSTSTAFDTVVHMTTTDLLSYAGTTTSLLANGSYNAVQTGVTGLTATSLSGHLTFSGNGTLANEITAATNVENHVVGTLDAFVFQGNTYVVEYNASSPVVVELVGVNMHALAIAGTTVHYT